MSEYKRRIELFSLYDHTNIEKHLEKMSAKGWMIDTIGSTLWRYKNRAPKAEILRCILSERRKRRRNNIGWQTEFHRLMLIGRMELRYQLGKNAHIFNR